jgi:5-methylcytosine-specific restriction endonuclease McrA
MTKVKTCATCGTTHFRSECPNGPHTWVDEYDFPEGAYPASHGDSKRGIETYHTRHDRTFEEVRHRALANYGYKCVKCGISDKEHRERGDLWPPQGGLHVHHKIDSQRFEEPSNSHIQINLVPLCDRCHKEETNG